MLNMEFINTPLPPKCLPKQAEIKKHKKEHQIGKIYIYRKKNIYDIYISLSNILLSNDNNVSK